MEMTMKKSILMTILLCLGCNADAKDELPQNWPMAEESVAQSTDDVAVPAQKDKDHKKKHKRGKKKHKKFKHHKKMKNNTVKRHKHPDGISPSECEQCKKRRALAEKNEPNFDEELSSAE